MKRFLKIMFALAVGFASVACHQEDIIPDQPALPEDNGQSVNISFGVTIPDEIEVKTRSIDGWQSPYNSIDESKRRSLRRAAMNYAALHRLRHELQFDLIAVVVDSHGHMTIDYTERIL